MPKKIILMRHGDYTGASLSNMGRRNVGYMADKLAEFLGDVASNIQLVSSSSPRAFQSAEILADKLQLEFGDPQVYQCLRAEYEDIPDPEEILKLIDETYVDVDVLIAVTHLPVVKRFPSIYAKAHGLGPWDNFPLYYAESVVMDLEAHSLTRLLIT